MSESSAQDQMNKILFTNLIMMLSSSAMQQLGKMVNPMTNKTEVNLEGAQLTIDMLSMIKEKTAGNLDEEENRLLTDTLSSLQLNYVETSKSAPADKQEPPASEPSSDQAAPAEEKAAADKEEGPSAQEPSSSPDADKKDPKYHKSYGS